jgi:hypothetical protein
MVMMTEQDIRDLKQSAEVMQKNGFPSMKNEIALMELILGEGK